MLFCSLGVGIVLAYHGMLTVGDRNCPSTLRSFPIPSLGYNTCQTIFLIQGPGSFVACYFPTFSFVIVDVSADLRLPHCMLSMINRVYEMNIS